MKWKRVVARHLVLDRSRVWNRFRNVHGCGVDLRSCPSPNLLIDVDACVCESSEVSEALRGRRKCDLVLIYGHESSVRVILIEASNTRYNSKFSRGIEQIVSTKVVLDEIWSSLDPEVDVRGHHGVLVSNISRRSATSRPDLRRRLTEHGINFTMAECGKNVWSRILETMPSYDFD